MGYVCWVGLVGLAGGCTHESKKPKKKYVHERVFTGKEDTPPNKKTTTHPLISEGYDTVSALNAGTAAQLLTQTEYDLVLLDINLPDGSGYDLCRLIKPENPDTLVIFLTANDQESDQIRGYEVGAVDYITKPFSIGALLRKIRAMFAMLEHRGWQRISMMTAGCFWIFRSSPLR